MERFHTTGPDQCPGKRVMVFFGLMRRQYPFLALVVVFLLIAPNHTHAQCGDPNTGNCCEVTVNIPGCIDNACCEAVCAELPMCCTEDWNVPCVNRAADLCHPLCGSCGFSSQGNCCVANFTPGCDDQECCEIVCALSPGCCSQFWGTTCAIHASNFCLSSCGGCGSFAADDCCTPNDTPYCKDESCCKSVCAVDPSCCDAEGGGEWDESCADLAWQLCPELDGCQPPPDPVCGDADTGDCCTANGTPYCNDADCCATVCDIDPYCCDADEGEWDSCCANLATQHCDIFPDCTWPLSSCDGHCGGQSPSGCWCDDWCQLNGDCCLDFCQLCPWPLGTCHVFPSPNFSCQGNCGGAATSGCWCDEACCQFGDCCVDKGRFCPGCQYGLGPALYFGDWCVDDGCGETSFSGCGCDEGCFERGDCCSTICLECPDFAGCTPPNPADLTGNGVVGVPDLLALLGNWGECQYERCFVMEPCFADFNHDSNVGVADLLFLLNNWGGG